MSKVSMTVQMKKNATKTTTKSISDISPTATNTEIKTFGQRIAALTTNTYDQTNRVEVTNVDTEATKLTPELKLTQSGNDIITVNGDGETKYIVSYNGDGNIYYNLLPTLSYGVISFGQTGSTRFIQFTKGVATKVAIHTTETNNYQAATVEYDFA